MHSKILTVAAIVAVAAFGTARADTIDAYDGGFPGDPGGNFTVGIGNNGELYQISSGVGFQRNADGFDPLAPGTPRDSWGVSIGGVSSYADQADFGTVNVSGTVKALGLGGGTVTSNVAGGTVKQTYQFVDENILTIKMAVTNTSGAAADIVVQRDVDWDVAPT